MGSRYLKLAALSALLVLLVSGCTAQESEMAGEEREAVLAYAGPVVDNMMEGFNSNEYGVFSRDFGEEMLGAMGESGFQAFREDIVSKIGLYQSRGDGWVLEDSQYVKAVYSAVFEGDPDAYVSVVFLREDEAPKVQGLHITSQKLLG